MSNSNLLKAVVKQVISGDTLVLIHPTKLLEKTVTLSHTQAPRLAKKGEETEEPFAFAAREFVRRKCIGKTVSFRLDYKNKNNQREHATVYLESQNKLENIAVSLLREGLAKYRPPLDHLMEGSAAVDLVDLETAETIAKGAEKGIWTKNEEEKNSNTRKIPNFSNEDLIKQIKNKTINVIVEYVVNGSTLKVQLPTFETVTLNLTGVIAPSTKSTVNSPQEQDQQLIAKEALSFVESRLLNRDIFVLFEGIDKNGIFFGTILRSKTPKENEQGPITFQEELLSRGMARIADWNIGQAKYVSRLKEAELQAKQAKLRLFKSYEAPTSTLTNEDQSLLKVRVIEVFSGDFLRVRHIKSGQEEKISLSSIRCPKFNVKPQGSAPNAAPIDEPFALDAREYVRKRVAGKIVQIKVDYRRDMNAASQAATQSTGATVVSQSSQEDMRKFCTLYVDNQKNLGLELITKGLATCIRHKQTDEKSPFYFQLMQAEKQATDSREGIHGNKENASIRRVNDLTVNKKGDTGKTVGQVQKFLKMLKGKKLRATVERVLSGSRLRLYLPTEYLMVAFGLSGISTPTLKSVQDENAAAKPFSKEAFQFTQEHVGLKDVEIILDEVDRRGCFLGTLIYDNTENLGTKLLNEGLGFVQSVAETFKNYHELKQAESVAQKAKKNIWSLSEKEIANITGQKEEDEVEEEQRESQQQQQFYNLEVQQQVKLETIRVTEFVDATHFYYQTADAAVALPQIENLIQQQLAANSNSGFVSTNQIREGEVILAKFSQDNQWYRAKVIRITSPTSLQVLYIDYGNAEQNVALTNIRPLLFADKFPPAQAKEAYLAFVQLHKDRFRNDALQIFVQQTNGHDLQAQHVYTYQGRKYVVLFLKDRSTSINSNLIKSGNVLLDRYAFDQVTKSLQGKVQVQPPFTHLQQWIVQFEKDLDIAKRERNGLFANIEDLYGEEEELDE